jgi:hypothetical protein
VEVRPVDRLESRPDLKIITHDQEWYSALLIELEAIAGGVRDLVKLAREAKP